MYDIAIIKAMIQRYLDAEVDLMAGKEVTISGRVWKSENLSDLRAGRAEWERKLRVKKGGSRPLLSRFS